MNATCNKMVDLGSKGLLFMKMFAAKDPSNGSHILQAQAVL